jgi:predicted Rdx family selenoprotein
MEKHTVHTIRMQLSPVNLAQFQDGMSKIQEEMSQLIMTAQENTGFPEANLVIDRIRRM